MLQPNLQQRQYTYQVSKQLLFYYPHVWLLTIHQTLLCFLLLSDMLARLDRSVSNLGGTMYKANRAKEGYSLSIVFHLL